MGLKLNDALIGFQAVHAARHDHVEYKQIGCMLSHKITGIGFSLLASIGAYLMQTAYFFYGIFLNLSIWYKLTKRTLFGAVITLIGAAITILINVIYIPVYSYMASAAAHFIAYFVMMVVTFIIGQRYFAIDYKVKRTMEYILVSIAIFAFGYYVLDKSVVADIIKGMLIVSYGIYGLMREKLISVKRILYAGKNS